MVNILCCTPLIDSDWCYDAYKKYIKEGSKVTVIPFSFEDSKVKSAEDFSALYDIDSGKYAEDFISHMARYGIGKKDVTIVDYFKDNHDTAVSKIQTADIIYFTGGLPDRMYDRILEFGIEDAIKAHKGVVMGFSAGAMVQMGDYHITPDEDYPEYCYRRGLGFVTDFDIEVHFERNELQLNCIKRAIAEKGKNIYAIYNDGALLIDEDGRITELGRTDFFGA